VIREGARDVVSVWRIVNAGWSVAIRMEPLRYLDSSAVDAIVSFHCAYPIANVRQSAEGAIAVMGSKIVLAEMFSCVDGSNNITEPWRLPAKAVSTKTSQFIILSIPKAMFPLRINCAVLISS
jgi:hypothetical protein